MPLNLQALENAGVTASRAAPALTSKGTGADWLSMLQASPVGQGADAFAHHAAGFFHKGANAVEGGVAGVLNYVAPGTALARSASQTAQADASAHAEWEKQYQNRVQDSPAATAGAVLGEIAPFATGANLITRGAAKVAELAPVAQRTLARALEGGTYGWLGSGGDGSSAAAGAGLSAALPPVLSGAARLATAPVRAVQSARNPAANVASSLMDVSGATTEPQKVIQALRDVQAGGNASAPSAPIASAPSAPIASAPSAPIASAPSAPSASTVTTADARQALIDHLKGYQDPVPGVTPTTAQAMASVLKSGNTSIVQLENALTNTQSGRLALAQQQTQNNAARQALLARHDIPDEQFQSLLNERRQWAQQQWQGMTTPVDAAPILDAIDTAMASGPAKRSPAVAKTLKDFKTNILSDIPEGSTLIDPSHLDARLGSVNELLAGNTPDRIGIPTVEGAGLSPVVSHVRDAIQAANPGYRDYLSGYAAKSQPISTAVFARNLLNASDGALGTGGKMADGESALTLTRVQSALKKAGNQDYPLSPQFMDDLTAVRDSIANSTVSDSIRTSGSPTFYNQQLGGALDNAVNGKIGAFDGWGAKALSGVTGGAAGVAAHAVLGPEGAVAASMVPFMTNSLFGSASQRLGANAQDAYIKALLNPSTMADFLGQVPADNPSALAQYLKNLPIVSQ